LHGDRLANDRRDGLCPGVANGQPNYGMVLADTDTDGVDFASSESTNRPS